MSEPIKIDFAELHNLKADGSLPIAKDAAKSKDSKGKDRESDRSDEGTKGDGASLATTVVVFAGKGLTYGASAKSFLGEKGRALVAKAAGAAKFKAKFGSTLDVIAPAGFSADRLLVVGVGGDPESDDKKGKGADKPFEPTSLGGAVAGKVGRGARAFVLFDLPQKVDDPIRTVSDFVGGLRLRDYRFDTYKTKKKDEAEEGGATHVTIAVDDLDKVEPEVAARGAVAEGVLTARSLVNEPANVLYPETFAEQANKILGSLGVEIEVLDIDAMQKLGMGALLGVSQGSARPGRLVVMRWNGATRERESDTDDAKKDDAKKDDAKKNDAKKNDAKKNDEDDGEGVAKKGLDKASKPIAFIGKGVTFDTGGISIKPSGGMEDMKGDMAGAACVVGLMQALAGRKAKVDVIGAIGVVENMPGPDAQRPGDIVTSMSGQTIEIINTDAEGRLVLADVCWYIQDKYKPQFMVDLATLTGAIIVALGQEHAGLFSNDDALADKILAAGKATGEKLWRMPLGPAYDKLIDSKFADVKNSGGRHASSVTAAQFIQRFVNDTPWAHLDIAGMGMNSPASDINQSWGSGWGVRLLDRLVADNYESK